MDDIKKRIRDLLEPEIARIVEVLAEEMAKHERHTPKIPPDRPYTPKTLAERWVCSEGTIRNMIKRGELKSFKAGGQLLRIPADEVRHSKP